MTSGDICKTVAELIKEKRYYSNLNTNMFRENQLKLLAKRGKNNEFMESLKYQFI